MLMYINKDRLHHIHSISRLLPTNIAEKPINLVLIVTGNFAFVCTKFKSVVIQSIITIINCTSQHKQ